ncbi:MAG TPA: hypothetical protein VGS21_05240, partial [Acidimicrobiales bacterium]|nr:hypothetical protein [Acidimicrobiales bacterium]
MQGDRRVDDWFWIRDREDPEVLALLREENRYTDSAASPLAALREVLFAEIRSRIAETDQSVAVRKDDWWYFSRTFEGSAYPVHCRAPLTSGPPPGSDAAGPGPWAGEQVVLDQNALVGDGAYLALSDLEVSPRHIRLVYGVDTTGDERFELRLRDLESGGDLPDVIEGVSYGVAWADDATFFYTRPDAANRPFQVWRHRLGTDPASDVVVFEEPDERFHVGLGRTKDGSYVVVSLDSKVTSEAWVVPSEDPEADPQVVMPRRQGVEYGVDHHSGGGHSEGGHSGDSHRGTFVVLTNDEAENFRLLARAVDAPPDAPWNEVIAHRPDVRLLDVDLFRSHLACSERVEGCARIRVVDLPLSRDPWTAPLPPGRLIPSPESPATFRAGGNLEFDTQLLRYEYTSLVTPRSVMELDMGSDATGDPDAVRQLKRQRVLGGYEPEDYSTERLWVTATDGRRVPVSIVRRVDTPLDGTAPCLLYGYGAYEHSIDPAFSSLRLTLLDRGMVFAVAHVRGGGE